MTKAHEEGSESGREIGPRARTDTKEGIDIVRSLLFKTPPLEHQSWFKMAYKMAVCSIYLSTVYRYYEFAATKSDMKSEKHDKNSIDSAFI